MDDKIHHYALKPGYKLHWYEIRKVLGRGGFGITYLAQDSNLERLVAIKEYFPVELAYRDNSHSVHPMDGEANSKYNWGLKRFVFEAQTLAKFSHPNIVRVIAVFEENKTGYMVMNYEEGEELLSLIKQKRTLDQPKLLGILLPLLDGLDKVHATGFIHRDIKPQNIIIRSDGSPILIDFGSARQALGDKTKTLTSLITPGYAPFEQYYSKSDMQGPWTDIYSMAATLYHCILGRVPLNAVDRSQSILNGSGDIFVSAYEIGNGRYSKPFLDAIDHGLKFKPEDRPQSISEWKKEFNHEIQPQKTGPEIVNEIDIVTEVAETSLPNIKEKEKTYAGYLKYIAAGIIIVIASLIIWPFQFSIKDSYQVSESKPSVDDLVSSGSGDIETGSDTENLDQPPETISRYIRLANQALHEQRMVKPERNNAYYYFNEVLQLDPGHAGATQGINDVLDYLVLAGRKAIDDDQLDTAKIWIDQAASIAPDNEKMITLRNLLLSKVNAKQQLLEEEQARQEQEKIRELLLLASSDIDALRMTSPAGNNAYERYQEILQLEPDNVEARRGLQRIADQYIMLAKRSADTGAYDNAISNLDKANRIIPESENIKKIRDEMEAKKREKEEDERLLALQSKPQETSNPENLSGSDETDNIQREDLTEAAVNTSLPDAENIIATIENLPLTQKTGQKQISLIYKGFDIRYQQMGLDQKELDSQIKSLLNNAGFNLASGSGSDAIFLELKFHGNLSSNTLWSWSASVSANKGEEQIWVDNYATGWQAIYNLKPAVPVYIDLVKKFIAAN